MTLANRITLLRIGLIPVFTAFARAYGRSVQRGKPREGLRKWATTAFLLAALSDGLDGYVARRYHQKSRLGTVLDPVADKGLMVSALTVLGTSGWQRGFPAWFPALVMGRDALLSMGYSLLKTRGNDVLVRPSWTGKTATVLQLFAILATLFKWTPRNVGRLVAAAALLTGLSGIGYVATGFRQALPGARAAADDEARTPLL